MNQRAQSGTTEMPRWQQILSAITGIAFLIILLAIAIFVPDPTEFQIFIFRTVLALAGGAFATIVSGFIHIHVKWQKFAIRAGAGLAVFVIIYLLNPPKLIKNVSSAGFIAPETIRSGDKSTAIVVPSDGSALSLLADKLVLDLQREQDELKATVTTGMSIRIMNNPANQAESVVNHLRGAVFLSKNSAATITVNVGGRIKQYNFPRGDKPDMERDGDIYRTDDFFRQITTPITWSSDTAEAVQYPITLSITATRSSKNDIALVAIDSLDAAVLLEGREDRFNPRNAG
jgi:hypothetical protein